ncbi:MAG TPA: 2-dehydropantoate 2-reductase [Thermomicrobiales bacterium]|nr:2-dehydropantoate 2-reductase [Thermomicrobiales bacterium]
MKITIVGAGAMGSLMAARLTLAMQAQSREPGATPEIERVLLYGRPSAHLDAIRKHGLELTERDGQHDIVRLEVSSTPADVDGSDLVVVLVKAWASADAVAPLKPYLTRDTIVLTLQNGLGNASQIRTALTTDAGIRPHVWLGVTTQAAVRTAPGKVRHTGTGITAIGRRTTLVHEHLSNLAATLTDADWRTVAVEDIHRWVWRKLAINAAINPLTALARVPNRAVNADPDLWQAAMSVAAEVVHVGEAQGVRLNQQQIIDGIQEVTRVTGDDRSSMLIDLENALRTEIEAINGQVVRHARRHNVPVPNNDLLLRLVRAHERGHRPISGTKEDSSYAGELDEAIRG